MDFTKLKRLLVFLKQPSSIAAIITIASLFGWVVTPEEIANWFMLPVLITGAWEFMRNEDKRAKKDGEEK